MSFVLGEPSRPLQYAKAIRESDLPTGVRTVCWAMATYANNKTGVCYPTVATLAKATGLSQPVVSKHTRVAEAMGYLRKDRRKDSSIIYTITLPVIDESPGTPTADTVPGTPEWGTGLPLTDWPGYFDELP